MIFDVSDQVEALLEEWKANKEFLEKLSPDTEKYRTVSNSMADLQTQIERWIRLGKDIQEDERRFEMQKLHEDNMYKIEMAKLESQTKANKRQMGLNFLNIGGILTEMLLVLNFEKFDALTSKAVALIPKIGLNLRA